MKNEIKNKKILVTGGAGFVGSHIAEKFIQEDVAQIIILDNFSRGCLDYLRELKLKTNLNIINADIRDKDAVRNAVAGVDFIFHQTAIRMTRCANSPRECLEIMVDGTFNVLEAAVEYKVNKIVFASSALVYGEPLYIPVDEKHPLNSQTMYGVAKISNEQFLKSFYHRYRLNYVILRYFNVYGPRMGLYGEDREVMIKWLDNIYSGNPPLIFGDGKTTTDFIYVEDVARANILAMKAPLTDEVFNIASGKEVSLIELLNLMLELTQSNLKPEFVQGGLNPVKRRAASVDKARKILGFEAKTELREGLERLILWYKTEKEIR